ncbi:uncharacterized protein MELLADRAFT_89516 [Melampsora larici-populina 98AG31]|uniref:Uncharacterized protein n=1 Tax=Melampsora larici-populina (strain 98AG31 / pathotype 3-4-7) TaxID=747676 RepID=F4RTM7_MELLP|nr:uncharacterized protein MELLADRAFT_89516 [Melampsora larici-populina 98AG31]EGG04311.1 hypothetical protein MELLADRAFT_89516 [Melampsora larici-populina 98AG31]
MEMRLDAKMQFSFLNSGETEDGRKEILSGISDPPNPGNSRSQLHVWLFFRSVEATEGGPAGCNGRTWHTTEARGTSGEASRPGTAGERCTLSRLWRKRRGNRTEAEMDKFLTLPSSIVALEKAVADITLELGTPEFNRLREATGAKAEALIRVRLAKMKLYEAKVGIVEAQKKWDKGGQGKCVQFTIEKIELKRSKVLKL